MTDVWLDKYNNFSRWMVRLEKIDLYTKSWWSAKEAPHYPPDFDIIKTPTACCRVCKKESKVIYKQGWACLNADPVKVSKDQLEKTKCSEFFKFGQAVDDKTLTLSEEFLLERTKFTGLITEPLAPALLTDKDVDRLGNFSFEEECKRGIVCPKCGCCSRRIEWSKWTCENVKCTFTYALTPRLIPAAMAIEQSMQAPLPPREKDYHDASLITHESFLLGEWKIDRYGIPDENGNLIGNIYRFRPSPEMNELPNGPDALFRQLQEADLGLKRNPVRGNNCQSSPYNFHRFLL